MDREEITTKIVKIITKRLKMKDASRLRPDAQLVDDLGADSLHCIEIVMDIEDVFDLHITDEQAETMPTIKSLVDHVEACLKEVAHCHG